MLSPGTEDEEAVTGGIFLRSGERRPHKSRGDNEDGAERGIQRPG